MVAATGSGWPEDDAVPAGPAMSVRHHHPSSMSGRTFRQSSRKLREPVRRLGAGS
jgi:hypothetical protein